jgi:hypothetical protein
VNCVSTLKAYAKRADAAFEKWKTNKSDQAKRKKLKGGGGKMGQ